MKGNILVRSISLTVVFLFIAVPVFSAQDAQPAASKKAKPGLPSCAVVELFTSEGCSTCPPADEFLADLVQKTNNKGPIYALSFHVDYWDESGWVDPFSSKVFTQRQRGYAAVKKSKDIYTPQMFVNGQEGFVGSNKTKAVNNIKMALSKPAKSAVDFTASVPKAKGFIKIDYQVSKIGKDQVLFLALVQGGIISKITGGENKGKTIRHENVVVGFKSIVLTKDKSGSAQFHLSPEDDLGKLSVIGYIQDINTLNVLGANRLDFSPQSKVVKK